MKNKRSQISTSVFLEPFPKSAYSANFERIEKDRFYYNAPREEGFFFGIYNVPLPATGKEYLEYIEATYHLQPQQLGSSISDGFKYVKMKD
jgi:hypothetical protein